MLHELCKICADSGLLAPKPSLALVAEPPKVGGEKEKIEKELGMGRIGPITDYRRDARACAANPLQDVIVSVTCVPNLLDLYKGSLYMFSNTLYLQMIPIIIANLWLIVLASLLVVLVVGNWSRSVSNVLVGATTS